MAVKTLVESIAGLRKKLFRNGVIVSIITYAKKGELILSPEIDMNDIHFDGILDSGAVGKVFLGSWKHENVAIKVCKRENVAFIKEDFYFEVALMSVIHHPHILPCLGAKLDRDSKFFVLISPLQEKGSLKTILKNENEEISDYRKVWIAYCIADALLHLHKNHIMHRDIKSSNILVGNNWESIYLTDFGTSRFFPKYDPTPLEGFIGTNEWMAPEILENENIDYNYKVDVYSFAILLFEIITRTIPFEGVKSWQICPIVKAGGRPVPLAQYKILNNLNSSFSNSVGSSTNNNNNNNSPGNSPRGEAQTISYLSNLDMNIVDPFAKCTPKELVTLMKECWHPSPKKRPKFSYIKNKLGILLKKVGKQPNAVIQPDTHTIKYRTDNESDLPKFRNETRRVRKNSLPKLPTNFIQYNFSNQEENAIKKKNSNELCYNSDTCFSGGYNSTSNSGGSYNNIIIIKSNSSSPREINPPVVDEEDENTLNDLDEQDNDD